MLLTRRLLRRLGRWLLGLLLLTHALVAAHACLPQDVAVASHGLTQVVAAQAPCSGHAQDVADTGDMLLCEAHCAPAQPLPAPSGMPEPAALDGGLWVLLPTLDLALPLATPMAAGLQAAGAPPPGWPPLYLFHRVLRN